jgi:hypothetical protein
MRLGIDYPRSKLSPKAALMPHLLYLAAACRIWCLGPFCVLCRNRRRISTWNYALLLLEGLQLDRGDVPSDYLKGEWSIAAKGMRTHLGIS